MRKLLDANPIYMARTQDVAYLDLTGCMALGVTGPILRAAGLPWDLRKSQPYCGYETYEFDVPTADALRRLRPLPGPHGRDARSRSRSSSSASTGCGPRPGDGRRQEDRLARAARARPRRPGQLARPHRAHHGQLDGGPDPPLQAGDRGLPGARRARPTPRSSRPSGELGAHVVSDGGTRPYRVHFRDPSFTNLQAMPAMCEGGMVADVIVAVASHRPGDGRCGPMSHSRRAGGSRACPSGTRARPGRRPSPALERDAKEIIGRYPKPRSALLPLLHLVQSEDGYVSNDGIEFCADMLGLTKAEVIGVATFYTMYKRSRPATTTSACASTRCARSWAATQIYDELNEHLGVEQRRDHRGREDLAGAPGVQRRLRLRPGVMVNWEFFDNQTPESAKQLVDDLRPGKEVSPTRGPNRCARSRGLPGPGRASDGLAADGPLGRTVPPWRA